jgi:hypothetical protein
VKIPHYLPGTVLVSNPEYAVGQVVVIRLPGIPGGGRGKIKTVETHGMYSLVMENPIRLGNYSIRRITKVDCKLVAEVEDGEAITCQNVEIECVSPN